MLPVMEAFPNCATYKKEQKTFHVYGNTCSPETDSRNFLQKIQHSLFWCTLAERLISHLTPEILNGV